MIWFTADTHFGHGGAIGRFKRPFRSVAEMDAELISRWNNIVAEDDEVWHLGDFAVRVSTARAVALLETLRGTKHLITGNNDGAPTVNQTAWASTQSYCEIEVA